MRIEKIHTDKNPSNMMTNVLSKETLELFSELAGLSSYKGSLGKSLSHDLEGEKKECFFWTKSCFVSFDEIREFDDNIANRVSFDLGFYKIKAKGEVVSL